MPRSVAVDSARLRADRDDDADYTLSFRPKRRRLTRSSCAHDGADASAHARPDAGAHVRTDPGAHRGPDHH